jgi:hypothetical protein
MHARSIDLGFTAPLNGCEAKLFMGFLNLGYVIVAQFWYVGFL